jgi:hypothetical protein
MTFFVARKEEIGAIKQFKKTCTYHGLDVQLSLKALTALKFAVEATLRKEAVDIGDRDSHTLSRRGLIRVTSDGETKVTELGLLVIALADAGGLVVTKGSNS